MKLYFKELLKIIKIIPEAVKNKIKDIKEELEEEFKKLYETN